MGPFLALLIIGYVIGMFVVARRHYGARHGVAYTRGTPLLNPSTFVGLLWPAVFFHEPWKNPALCQHMGHVEARQRARTRYQAYQKSLGEEADGL